MLLKFKNCLFSVIFTGCLVFITVVFLLFILIRNLFWQSSEEINNEVFRFENDGLKVGKNLDSIKVDGQYESEDLRIIIITDTESEWQTLENAVSVIKDEYYPEYVFHLGDLTTLGVTEDFVKAKGILDSLGINYSVIPGDRDRWKTKDIDTFKKYFIENYGIVEVSGLKFLLIDNSDEISGIDREQWEFIQDNLANVDIVLMHNPIHFDDTLLGFVRKGMGQYSDSVEIQRIELLDSIRENQNIKLIFAGDQHLFSSYEDAVRSDLHHYVVGALNRERNIYNPNFVLLSVDNEGYFTVERVSIP